MNEQAKEILRQNLCQDTETLLLWSIVAFTLLTELIIRH